MPGDQERLDLSGASSLEEPTAEHGPDSDTLEDDPFLADLSGVVQSLFSVWSFGSEEKWAASAWRILAERGLTDCSTVVRRARTLCRLGALATVYRETCARYLGDGSEGEWLHHLDALWDDGYPGLREFSLGLLAVEAGVASEDPAGADWDDYKVSDYLALIIEAEYDVVVAALLDEWGSAELVATIVHSAQADATFPLSSDVRGDILNDYSADTATAYQWVENGMPLHG